MELIIIDLCTSVLQSAAMAYTISYCVDKNVKLNKVKIFIMTLLFFVSTEFYTEIFGVDWVFSIFLSHMLSLGIIFAIYRKNFSSAIAAYTIIYFIIGVYSIIFACIIFEYARRVFPSESVNNIKILILYIPKWLILLIYFKCLGIIKQIYKFIIYKNFLVIFFIMSLVIDFILTFYLLTVAEESQLIKNIIYVMFFLFFVVILVYFWKVQKKSQQIYRLNKSLELKNSELRKIKHDYGAQISYLYGLCLMERFGDLKKALKDIINNNDATSTAVTITKDEKSLLSIALKPALDQGIHVIIEDNCDLALVDMNELELYGVISNIANNAVNALNGKGIIIAKSYEYLGNAIIKIEDNGSRIPEDHLNEIFEDNFTTKKNSDKNHECGMSMVKDFVRKNNGEIYVKSNDEVTEFKIVIPIHGTMKK